VAELEQAKQRLIEQSRTHESSKAKLLKEVEDRFVLKTRSLEAEIESLKSANQSESDELSGKYEESMNYLKNQYELEKQRLE